MHKPQTPKNNNDNIVYNIEPMRPTFGLRFEIAGK